MRGTSAKEGAVNAGPLGKATVGVITGMGGLVDGPIRPAKPEVARDPLKIRCKTRRQVASSGSSYCTAR
jgi:hypothetical protein